MEKRKVDAEIWIHPHPVYLGDEGWEEKIEGYQDLYGGEKIGVAVSDEALPRRQSMSEDYLPLYGEYDDVVRDPTGYAAMEQSKIREWGQNYSNVLLAGIDLNECIGSIINSFLWLENPPEITVDPQSTWIYDAGDPLDRGLKSPPSPAPSAAERSEELDQFVQLYTDGDPVTLLEP
ncbi:MAG: hypothetical protein MUP63_00355 [Candidatus Nanohaloarchaeota archaeon QJJ-7]|nr:hypothetical protein [Candidatus Nanohaloarchaeota archaeon QJJ-7]